MPRNKANDGLGEMDVEVVANDIPPCVGRMGSHQRFQRFTVRRQNNQWIGGQPALVELFTETDGTIPFVMRPVADIRG